MGNVSSTGKRARNRATRHRQLIESANAIIAERGLDGLTMQEVAERVDCAVGTIYTYFPSKSALLAAIQGNAVRKLADSYEAAAIMWDESLDDQGTDPDVAALARLLALSRLVVSWPDLLPREFEFLQMLIGTTERYITAADAQALIPEALMLFSEGRVMIEAAVDIGAIQHDPDRPGDDSLARTVRWVGGLDGAIMVAYAARLVADIDPDAFDRNRIAEHLTVDLLDGWGASREVVRRAIDAVNLIDSSGQLLPAVP